jgi:hypothetical protein
MLTPELYYMTILQHSINDVLSQRRRFDNRKLDLAQFGRCDLGCPITVFDRHPTPYTTGGNVTNLLVRLERRVRGQLKKTRMQTLCGWLALFTACHSMLALSSSTNAFIVLHSSTRRSSLPSTSSNDMTWKCFIFLTSPRPCPLSTQSRSATLRLPNVNIQMQLQSLCHLLAIRTHVVHHLKKLVLSAVSMALTV